MVINETDVKLFVDSGNKVLDIRKSMTTKVITENKQVNFKTHYLFETESVLFKPTLTREEIFRIVLTEPVILYRG